jgi:hypothetical protein
MQNFSFPGLTVKKLKGWPGTFITDCICKLFCENQLSRGKCKTHVLPMYVHKNLLFILLSLI